MSLRKKQDYMENLPRRLAANDRSRLYMRQLGGYAESRIIAFGPENTAYLMGLEIGTDLGGGIIISGWKFIAPWEHAICWDYDVSDLLPTRIIMFMASFSARDYPQ